jgi:hypothetical protein
MARPSSVLTHKDPNSHYAVLQSLLWATLWHSYNDLRSEAARSCNLSPINRLCGHLEGHLPWRYRWKQSPLGDSASPVRQPAPRRHSTARCLLRQTASAVEMVDLMLCWYHVRKSPLGDSNFFCRCCPRFLSSASASPPASSDACASQGQCGLTLGTCGSFRAMVRPRPTSIQPIHRRPSGAARDA